MEWVGPGTAREEWGPGLVSAAAEWVAAEAQVPAGLERAEAVAVAQVPGVCGST